jgi:2'-5' RNA ligase
VIDKGACEAGSHRLFFALWPEQETLRRLQPVVQRLQRASPAHWLPAERLHLTLAFLGAVEAERLPAVLRCGQAVRSDAGELLLDRVEYWRGPGVICLTSSSEHSAVDELAADLAKRLRESAFTLEKRPFRAHLTLARKCTHPPPEAMLSEPIRWPPCEFSLVESVATREGSYYRILASWPLPKQAMPDDAPMK